jgi:hypothetical protein
MAIIHVQEFEESFVIHFRGDFTRINAYTLASTLVALADAARAANASINPGFDIEVLVEAFGQGSFRAKIKAVYRAAANLFSTADLKQFVLAIIAAYIAQQAFAPDQQVKVTVATDEVVIEQGDTKVVIPREVYNAVEETKHVPEFCRNIGRAFDAVERDQNVSAFGISTRVDDPTPPINIPRDRFPALSLASMVEEGETREFVETTELQIMRAILERSRRRWEFVWRGIRISAPVLDERFYQDFFAHKITIAPGDSLDVRLRVRQRKHPDSGVYVNDPNGYEVLEVVKHIPRPQQPEF